MSDPKLSQYIILSKSPDFFLIQHRITHLKAYYKEYFGSKLSQKEYFLVLETFTKRKNIQSPNILEIFDYSITNTPSLPNDYKFGLIYEFWTQNFDNELKTKCDTCFYWTEEELLNTVEASIHGLWAFHCNGLTHGDIRACNIVVNDGGFVQLADQFVTSSFYKKSLQQIIEEKASLLAPELLETKGKSTIETPENDIWALGMIFLEAACLLEVKSCYDWDRCCFNWGVLERRLEFVREKYTSRMNEILLIMLNKDPLTRRKAFTWFGIGGYESYSNEKEDRLEECVISPKFEQNIKMDEKIKEEIGLTVRKSFINEDINRETPLEIEGFSPYKGSISENSIKNELKEGISDKKNLSIENILEKHGNSKEDCLFYIKKQINKREKSLETLYNLLKQAENLKTSPLKVITNEILNKKNHEDFFEKSIDSFIKPQENNIKFTKSPKKSSLSLIKDKYFPNILKNFDEFSIIKNEESLSFQENESNYLNPSNKQQISTINKRLDACFSKENPLKSNITKYLPSPLEPSLDEAPQIPFKKGQTSDFSLYPPILSFPEENEREIPALISKNSIKTPQIKKITYENGDFYEGEVLKTLRNGYGTLYKGNRAFYQGEWLNDLFNGHGVLYNLNIINIVVPKEGFPFTDFSKLKGFWLKYEGGFHQGEKEGNGVLTLCNKEFYQGMFKGDKINGKGSFQRGNGKRVIGEWSNGKLVNKIN